MNDETESASLFERLRQWLASSPQEAQPAGQAVADEINRALPESLSARPGIEEDRRRKAMIEEMLRSANQ